MAHNHLADLINAVFSALDQGMPSDIPPIRQMFLRQQVSPLKGLMDRVQSGNVSLGRARELDVGQQSGCMLSACFGIVALLARPSRAAMIGVA